MGNCHKVIACMNFNDLSKLMKHMYPENPGLPQINTLSAWTFPPSPQVERGGVRWGRGRG